MMADPRNEGYDEAALDALAGLELARDRNVRTHEAWASVPPAERELWARIDAMRASLETADGPAVVALRGLLANAAIANCPNAYRLYCLDQQSACVRGPTSGRD